jgi:hypothetical protein
MFSQKQNNAISKEHYRKYLNTSKLKYSIMRRKNSVMKPDNGISIDVINIDIPITKTTKEALLECLKNLSSIIEKIDTNKTISISDKVYQKDELSVKLDNEISQMKYDEECIKVYEEEQQRIKQLLIKYQ